ncbi:hypothetical protein GDO81_001855 [Engystomops pustulosus]|uniref:Ig-like domain-containing protein n=1 Tax=Engystomops pustulosus TaxID=76066 RepID=A0AAV7DG42_ENGPU|nr:hypothetical protein GDO81_001855 [Engystomops pustulosus]
MLYCFLCFTVSCAAMKTSHILFIFLSLCPGEGAEDYIEPLVSHIKAVKGMNVTLSCSFSSSYRETLYLLWYRQYPGSAPQFLSYRANQGVHSYTDPTARRRFTSEVKSKFTNLLISDVKTEDSATYLCALQAAQCHIYILSSYTNL